jgi:hypothetical protein
MRLSRVPVPSLDRRDLVYDPGGLRHVSPYRRRRILRSSAMKLSAFALEKEQASYPRLILQDHHFQTTFEAQYRPRRLASLGSRPSFPPAYKFRYRAGG